MRTMKVKVIGYIPQVFTDKDATKHMRAEKSYITNFIGKIGIVQKVDKYDYPFLVKFNNGSLCRFKLNELAYVE